MSKLTNSTKIDQAKTSLKIENTRKKFEKAHPEQHNTFAGEKDGESLTKVYQPPKPDLKK